MIEPRPLAGSAEEAEDLAGWLTREAARLAATARLLRSLSTRGRAAWDSAAGDRFGALAGAAAGNLDRIATRYAGSAAAVRGFAQVLGEAQQRSAAAIAAYEATLPAFLRHGDLMVTARASPDPVVVASAEGHRALMVEAGERLDAAQRSAAQARQDWEEADRSCAAVLSGLLDDGLADTATYNALTGLGDLASAVSQTVGPLGPLTLLPLPPLRVVGAVGTAADVVSVAADGTVLAVYGDGDPGALAVRAALAAVGPAGAVLRKTSIVTRQVGGGTRALRPGTRVYARAMRPLAPGERVGLGVRQGLAEAFGKGANVLPAHSVAWTRMPRGVGASTTWARQQVQARATAYARNAWLDDWDRACGSGRGARTAFVAGTALQTADPALDQLGSRPDRPRS